MRIDFHPSPEPTIGVEWELALVDRDGRDLAPTAAELFERVTPHLDDADRLHPELLRNTIEVVTGVCDTVGDAVAQQRGTLEVILSVCDDLGVDLYGAGTHPFASWQGQELTPDHRYVELIQRTQWWGRQLLIWGVHVHVGLPERDRVLPVLAGMLPYAPHLQALSASSPLWAGVDTGYASNRALMFQQLPTAGLPYQFEQWQQYESFAHDQLTTGAIPDLGQIHWDIRPSPKLGTLETRVCDGVSTIHELGALAALVQCLVVDLDSRIAAGETVTTLPPWHVVENKWRAARYGLDADVIVDRECRDRPVTDDLAELLPRLAPTAERLGCSAELAAVTDIVRDGASYQRQRTVAEGSGDLVAVVEAVVRELRESLT